MSFLYISVVLVLITSMTIAQDVPLWQDTFSNEIVFGDMWVANDTSCFEYHDHNPKDNKLDWIRNEAVTIDTANGHAIFTATPSNIPVDYPDMQGLYYWYTGLLTTEYSAQQKMVATNNYIEANVQLTSAQSSWPALFTWKVDYPPGQNEVDSFEYHPDIKDLLEFTNHIQPYQELYRNPYIIYPGAWVTIGTHYGADYITWYLNGKKVYSICPGVGAGWSAYVTLSLSISAGKFHPAPANNDPIIFRADYVRVFPSLPSWLST